MGVGLRSVNYKEEKPKLDRPEVEKAVQADEEERKFWDGRAAQCGQALELMRQARPKVLPGSREELDYVIFKTENFITVFEGELSTANEAKAAFDRALLAMSDGKADEVRKHLDQCQAALDRANRLVRQAAEQMIPYAQIPTERHILYLFNDAIPSHEGARRYLSEVIAFRIGTRAVGIGEKITVAFRSAKGDSGSHGHLSRQPGAYPDAPVDRQRRQREAQAAVVPLHRDPLTARLQENGFRLVRATDCGPQRRQGGNVVYVQVRHARLRHVLPRIDVDEVNQQLVIADAQADFNARRPSEENHGSGCIRWSTSRMKYQVAGWPHFHHSANGSAAMCTASPRPSFRAVTAGIRAASRGCSSSSMPSIG